MTKSSKYLFGLLSSAASVYLISLATFQEFSFQYFENETLLEQPSELTSHIPKYIRIKVYFTVLKIFLIITLILDLGLDH
jgi:hypothetical protein